MSELKDAPSAKSQTKIVTYIIVVHGIGEQRKNECVINVVNRFAEARRGAREDDNRDVLTLGKASGQTGLSKVPVTEQPWMEFMGIPASAKVPTPSEPFLGEPETSGTNLRFVDLCWSDVMQDSIEHVGQDVGLWAKGLLGRLLRKHEAAKKDKKDKKEVPFWIRRVLHLLIDTLLLVRFAMNFRFKEMKELVFVKFLGDVQLYGEYDRCRGRAVRRFHELMAKVEAEHEELERKRETPREARYVIIAHSLGSIMSLDALLYASATSDVRRGADCGWRFPGYLRDDDKKDEPRKEGWFALLDTDWIERVQSFVTLGSPIDKYLTIWWLNYRYLLKSDGRLRPRKSRIKHFNYCDELDPVGHKLDVVQQTAIYDAVFECGEDIVFNRYCVPGVAHNKYWTDPNLFRWILQRAIDDKDDAEGPLPFWHRVTSKLPSLSRWLPSSEQDDQGGTAAESESPVRNSDEADKQKKRAVERPRWFRLKAYAMLLVSLYSLVPALVLVGTFASLTLAFQADGWRTAIMAAVASSFLAHFGRRLIDLNIWWRQIQRQQRHEAGSCCNDPQRSRRRWTAWVFRVLVAAVPLGWATLTIEAFRALAAQGDATTGWPALCCLFPLQDHQGRPLLVAAVAAVVSGLLTVLAVRNLPAAYRTPAFDGRRFWPKAERTLLIAVYIATLASVAYVATQVVVGLDPIRFLFPSLEVPGVWVVQLALIGILATTIYSYRLYRFVAVKYMLHSGPHERFDYNAYADDP